MSQEKVRLLKAFGAEVVITPTAVPPDHPDNYVMKAKQIVHETPGAVLADQFYNQANPEAHYRTTGPEIWEQTEGEVTHFVAGAGTGGTVSGAGKYLKEKNPKDPGDRGRPDRLAVHRTTTAPRTMGEGQPYKVEGIGGDKIPTTHLVRLDRRVPPGDRSRRRSPWPGGSPARKGSWPAARPASTCALALEVARGARRPQRAGGDHPRATPASATCRRCSTTSGCRRTRCSRRPGSRGAAARSGGRRTRRRW